ncbi:hypothetical protein SOVF_109640 [Spinacia oleracea]|nr:hypothetical protein SOVF_109640 [Spinacia oleracea]
MTPPNSTSPTAESNLLNDQEALSSMETTPLSPQPEDNVTPEELSNIEDILRVLESQNMDPIHSNRFSLATSDSHSSRGTAASVADDEHSVSIEEHLYRLLTNGKKDEILSFGVNLEELKTKEDKNSVLHIAASAGQAELITDILPKCKGMIEWKNSKGDLAFHSAAKAAQFNALKALIDWIVKEGISREMLGWENNEGNTALHIALENNQQDMARVLVGEFNQACYQLNKQMISPLYLAIKSGYWMLVKHMISCTMQQKAASEDALLRGKSIVHAAIEAKNLEILKEILNHHRHLIVSMDDEGRTPLSYAAYKGYIVGVQYLLKEFPDCAFKRDKDEEGSFPIHKAASGGNIKVIKELHNTKRLLNRKEQNILHIAAASGKSKLVSYLLKLQELEGLINLKDEDGNTPLHLATKGFHPRVVYILTRENRCKCELQNKDGLTALDLAEIHSGSFPTFEARLTWMALRYVDAPRSSQSTRKRFVQKDITRKQNQRANDKNELESYKDRVDTHLLVATLVATVTFAAGFTLPGGYNQSDPDIGMAVLAHRWAFKVFVICNTAALYSSILSVVTLIWAHMGDLKLVLVSLRFALPLLGFALAMMSLAFMMGIFVVLKTVTWLSYVVLGMGSVFLLVVLVFFIPLYNPSYIRNSVVRFFFSGTFLLLLLVCENSSNEYA